jgi:hypothetical protein
MSRIFKTTPNAIYFVLFMIVLGSVYYFTQRQYQGKVKEAFEPISTCAKGPYRENNKTYWKSADPSMCAKTDFCQVERDNQGRVEFAVCVTKPLFSGA